MSKFPAEPRYSPQHKDCARATKGCMFTLNLNRQFTKCGNAGGSTTVQGVVAVDSERYKYLYLAMMLVNGISLEDSKIHVGLGGEDSAWCSSCDCLHTVERPKCKKCGDWMIFNSTEDDALKSADELMHDLLNKHSTEQVKELAKEGHRIIHDLAALLSSDTAITTQAENEINPMIATPESRKDQ